ncbi:transcription termination factor MTERF15, mitochondrial-like isoform X1 [Tripterygium wilfordii]|uniref:transcription termination factor MTERF15, mitochondrial-like isoform X1 n=1 Tax=Tripterygium wilfordii TaxID=458696 RepID=UPI0018F804FB|nr:transcription termination factor MTERF15, mitochondrial-like isoform X1 [Tripterygium wilfordii]
MLNSQDLVKSMQHWFIFLFFFLSQIVQQWLANVQGNMLHQSFKKCDLVPGESAEFETPIDLNMKPNNIFVLADKEKTLLPKLEFLQSVGISGAALADVVSSNRIMLRQSLKNQIIPTYNFLKNLLEDDEKVAHALKRAGFLYGLHNTAAPNISLLQRLGVPHSSMLLLVTRDAHVLCNKAEKFDAFVKMISGMGFNPSEKNFIIALRIVNGLSRDSWERKLKAFKEWGFSKDEILLAFRRYPNCMTLSVESISRRMDFLVSKMGWASPDVAKAPSVVSYSMEKRIIPRYSVIQALLFKGLINKKPALSSVINPADDIFLKRFVNRYQEQEPQLSDIFEGKMKLSDLGIGFGVSEL